MKAKLFASAIALFFASPALAAEVMTFDNLGGEFASPFSNYTENGFTLRLISGYATKASTGVPAPGVVNYGFNVGYDLTALGNLFSFNGFGLSVASSNFTNYGISGSLAGVTVFSYSGSQSDTSDRFLLMQSPSNSPVDRVNLIFNNFGRVQGASTIDNISTSRLTGSDVPGGSGIPGAVPEPGTWAMMLLGFGGMGVALRRRRRPVLLREFA